MPENIKLPGFALPLFHGRLRCCRCRQPLAECDVTFAGAARDKDGSICFAFEAKCAGCQRINTVMDTTRKFTTSDWWEQLSVWHYKSPESAKRLMAEKRIPNAPARMLIGPPPLQSVDVLRGYKGDIGPVILRCYGPLFGDGTRGGALRIGSLRLEPDHHIRVLRTWSNENMPRKG